MFAKDDAPMKKLILLLLAMHTIPSVQAKDFSYADSVTYLGTEQIAKQLKRAVFAVQIEGNHKDQEKSNDWIPIGSGFFVLGTNNVVLGVTCNHVVADHLDKQRNIYVGLETEKGYKRALSKVAYQDAENDIAILVIQRRPNDSFEFQSVVFEESLLGDDVMLIEGRGVLIPGYPLALGVEDDRNNPVIRHGMIAQFSGKKYFLIDGVASHGNSGSPVFALAYKNERLVGMITSFLTDRIDLFDENRKLSAQLSYNSGLARAVTMTIIKEALQKALGKY